MMQEEDKKFIPFLNELYAKASSWSSLVILSVDNANMAPAVQFKAYLEDCGYSVFLNQSMGNSSNLPTYVAVTKSVVFIPFVDAQWCSSSDCAYELNMVLQRRDLGKGPDILPILLEGFAFFMENKKKYPQAHSLAIDFPGFTATKKELNNRLWEQVLIRLKEKQILPQVQGPVSAPMPTTTSSSNQTTITTPTTITTTNSISKPLSLEHKHIIISYNWKSKDFASKLYDELVNAGYKVWMDIQGGIRGGDNIYEKMAEGLEGAVIFVPIITKQYAESENCKLELTSAVGMDSRLLPIKAECFEYSGWLRVCLASIKWYNFYDERNTPHSWVAESLLNLLADINYLIPPLSPARTHPPMSTTQPPQILPLPIPSYTPVFTSPTYHISPFPISNDPVPILPQHSPFPPGYSIPYVFSSHPKASSSSLSAYSRPSPYRRNPS